MSLGHSLRGKTRRQDFESGQTGYSFVWLDQCTKALSDGRLFDMVIDLAVPWFVNFYVSWYRLREQRSVDALWVTYEELFADKEKTVRKVLDLLGLTDIGTIARSSTPASVGHGPFPPPQCPRVPALNGLDVRDVAYPVSVGTAR